MRVSLKAILWTVVLAFGIFAACKIVPPYVAEFQLANAMQEQARYAVVNRYGEEKIRNDIFKTMQDLDIPATREQIKVTASIQVVTISVDYTVPVDLLVYQTQLHFTPSSQNKSIL